MPGRLREAILPVVAGGLASCICSASAAGSVEVFVQEDRVGFRATDVPLRSLLEAIGAQCGIDIRSGTALEEPVTVTLAPMPVGDALRKLLREHSYMLLSDAEGSGVHSLWILAPGGGEDVREPSWSSDRDAAIDAIVLDLGDPDPEVREEAVLSLGDIGGQSVVPFLLPALVDSSGDVRRATEAVLDDIDQNSQSTPTAGTSGSQ